jgi:hypothetical protein
MQGFRWSLGVLSWLLRDEPHIVAIDLHTIPRFARRRLLIIAPATVAGIDRTKRNALSLGPWHTCQSFQVTGTGIATREEVMAMGSAIGAVDIGAAGALARIMASARDATKGGYAAFRCDPRARHWARGRACDARP